MFEFTEFTRIAAPATTVWQLLADIDGWWIQSNPDHIRIDVDVAETPIGVGTPAVFEERIVGIKGRAEGTIVWWGAHQEASWEEAATYRYGILRFHICEGVSWRIDSHDAGSILSAHVWAEFPNTRLGRAVE